MRCLAIASKHPETLELPESYRHANESSIFLKT